MNAVRMLVTARFNRDELQRLGSVVDDVRFAGFGVTSQKLTEDQLARELQGIDVLISEYEPITQQVLEAAPQLKLIGCCRTGPAASVDIAAATERGIPVLYSPGRNAVSVAEYTIGLMISAARHIAKVHHLLRHTSELTQVRYTDKAPERLNVTSEWSLDPRAPFNRFQGPELAGKTLGLVGCGAIGQAIARRATAFDMRVVTYDPYVADEVLDEMGVRRVDLEGLTAESDFVAMAAKVTPETMGLFSADLIRAMKPTAYFINTARAALVDYDALYQALKQGAIAGAALDVYRQEPMPEDNPFRELDNVVLSPHLAGASTDIPQHHSRMMVDDLLLVFNGEKPARLANPDAWATSRFAREENR